VGWSFVLLKKKDIWLQVFQLRKGVELQHVLVRATCDSLLRKEKRSSSAFHIVTLYSTFTMGTRVRHLSDLDRYIKIRKILASIFNVIPYSYAGETFKHV
jgi:hypothetical protein